MENARCHSQISHMGTVRNIRNFRTGESVGINSSNCFVLLKKKARYEIEKIISFRDELGRKFATGRSEEGEEKEKRDTKQGKRNNENSRERGENKCR